MDYTPKCKAKIIKLLGENISENLCDLGLRKYFLGTTPKARSILGLHQNKQLLFFKRQLMEIDWENILCKAYIC